MGVVFSESEWPVAWGSVALGFAVLGLILRFICRDRWRYLEVPSARGETSMLDSDNPYAATVSTQAPQSEAWEKLRQRTTWLRIATSGSLALGSCLLVIALFGQRGLLASLPLAGCVAGIAMSLLELPTRNKILSFARLTVILRGVPAANLHDELFIGASMSCVGERIGNSADRIGFVHLTEGECLLHLDDGDVVVPRASVLSIAQAKIRGDTMALFGMRLVEMKWASAGESEPRTLYLIAWGGETSLAIKHASERLYQRLAAWAAGAPG